MELPPSSAALASARPCTEIRGANYIQVYMKSRCRVMIKTELGAGVLSIGGVPRRQEKAVCDELVVRDLCVVILR